MQKEIMQISPQDDFFMFVNGKWLAENPIPPSESSWGAFNVLRDVILDQLRLICEDMQKTPDFKQGSNTQIIGDFYTSGMDIENRNKEGLLPLNKLLNQIEEIKSIPDVARVLAKLHALGFGPLFNPYVYKDYKNPDISTFFIHQGGLGLPDRDYYLEDSKDMQKIRDKYQEYIVSMFKKAGYSQEEAGKMMEVVYGLELELANASIPKELEREVDKNYHKYTPKKARIQFSAFGWEEYLNNIGATKLKNFIIEQPAFFTTVNNLFQTKEISAIKLYLKWNIINNSASYLSEDFASEKFDFYGRTLQGLKEQKPLWKQVVGAMQSGILTESLGPLYVGRHFSEESKKILHIIINDVKIAFKDRVNDLGWMDEDTKNLVYKKVDNINFKLGYPDEWIDISALKIDKRLFLQNVLNVQEFEFKRKMKEAGGPADWTQWVMAPTTVNACADQMREMTFPAAILQDVFFNPSVDMAYNYGAFGSVAGHELTHFVDDQGCKFDVSGKLQDWWPENVKQGFKNGSKAFIAHYSKYSVEGVPVNAEYTLGENIGDVAGLTIGFAAYKKYQKRTGENEIIDGLTPEQRYFIGYARTECGLMRLEERKRRYKTDPHSPSEVRVNAALSIIPYFVEAFGIKPGDQMYIPPQEYPALW
ncbi:M13 family metallopeptidase [Candidatus Daviesbacteria bacterium]|nr:M13 family metallopeptidase [Candidatus Daviesbacteria bacterium]